MKLTHLPTGVTVEVDDKTAETLDADFAPIKASAADKTDASKPAPKRASK